MKLPYFHNTPPQYIKHGLNFCLGGFFFYLTGHLASKMHLTYLMEKMLILMWAFNVLVRIWTTGPYWLSFMMCVALPWPQPKHAQQAGTSVVLVQPLLQIFVLPVCVHEQLKIMCFIDSTFQLYSIKALQLRLSKVHVLYTACALGSLVSDFSRF